MANQSRRDFLKTGALSTMFLGSGLLVGNGCAPVRAQGKAKNVIFLVSDGMSSGTLTLTDVLLRRKEGRASNWVRLYEEGIGLSKYCSLTLEEAGLRIEKINKGPENGSESSE
jgi:hypothetical protein